MKKNTSAVKSVQTVEKIITASRAAFAENGYSGAHMDNIAKRAGVNKATIYYQIGDKDALYAAVIHQVLGNIARQIGDAVAHCDHPQEKIAAYIRSIAAAAKQNPELPSIMLREVASDGAHLPRVVLEDIASVVLILTDIIENGKKKGLFADVTPFLVHCMIMGGILLFNKISPIKDRQTWLPDAITRYDKKLKSSEAEEITKLILTAIKKEPGGKR